MAYTASALVKIAEAEIGYHISKSGNIENIGGNYGKENISFTE